MTCCKSDIDKLGSKFSRRRSRNPAGFFNGRSTINVNSWADWPVDTLTITDGINASPMKTTYAYSGPCYNDPTAGWCNASHVGELTGFAQTIVTNKDSDGTTPLAISLHKFDTGQMRAGTEYETQHQDASGMVLSRTDTFYASSTAGLPSGGYFNYIYAVDQYLRSGGSLNRVSHSEYSYYGNTGSLASAKQFDGTPTLYRQTDYQYISNTSPSVWILGKVWKQQLKNASGTVLSEQQFGYDGSLPGSGSLSLGSLTLSRQVNGSQTIDTGFTYDIIYGNLTQTRAYTAYGNVLLQPGGSYNSASTAYDTTLYTYPISATNVLNQSVSTTYDYALGVPLTVTDPNGGITTTTYDGLGRPLTIKYPGYSQPNVQYTYPGSTATAPFALKMDLWDETASLYRSVWQIADGLGRALQSQAPDQTAGSLVLTDTSYNALGQVKYSGLPRTFSGAGGSYFAPTWASVPHTVPVYDALGRTTNVTYPDGSQETTTYAGLRTTGIDRSNHQKTQENDAFGRLVKVEEYTGSGTYTLYATTTYQYDPRDLLTLVTDAQNNQTSIGYNGFGRKISMTDPDMGVWGYTYDTLGNLLTQTDARTCVTTVSYDALNRPTGKTYSGPGACATTPAVTYTYDSTASGNKGIGNRTGMTDGSGSSAWVYNALGQVANQTNTVDGIAYTSSATSDAFGRPLTQTLPSGEVLNYGYTATGALSSLTGTNTYLSNVHYNASGQVIDQQLGNGILQQSCYDANNLRLTSLRAYPGTLQTCGTNPSSPRLNLSYTYQPNGNVSQVVDSTRAETLTYTYDELDRLLSASGPYSQTFSYDSIGNLTTKGLNDSFTTTATGPAGSHTCGLTTNGGVKCWGNNSNGQLGDGTNTNSTAPVNVSGLSNGVINIAAGTTHTCALTSSGGVKCWGDNSYGRLGDGTTIPRLTPVDVIGLSSGVIAIAAGAYHACALTTGGGVKCWGDNSSGQLGDGTTTGRSTPADVTGLTSGVTAISAGQSSTCARTASGGMKCWGYNGDGRLGDGTTTQRLTPVDVSGFTSGVTAISAGSRHNCALTTAGGIKCWGQNTYGQLGDGTTNQALTPVDVNGLISGVSTISGGETHTCVLTTGAGLKCWGDNTYGQLGDGTTTQRLTPVNVSGLASGVTVVSTGTHHTCALLTGGAVKCWGDNSSGQLAIGTTSQSTTPVNINGLSSVPSPISAGQNHTCSLATGGAVKCWGDNASGQLGDGTTAQRTTPVSISGLTGGVISLTAGWNHTCAVTSSGGAKCWGANAGRLGDGTTTARTTPVDVSGLTSGVSAIAAGAIHTCALTTTGGVKCWGTNTYGQLGDGTTTTRLTPVDVSGLTSGVTAIAVGAYQTCALTTTGGLKCWGYNSNAQLGDGTTTNRLTPVDVSGLTSGVIAIAAGANHTCALTSSAGIKCWGYNGYGQLGDATATQRATPVNVSGLTSGVAAISTGQYHTCALTTAGGMKCWGYNIYGQVGDGTTTNRLTPVDVSGLTNAVTAITAGLNHSCALKLDGSMKCWGINNYGQVGDGTTTNQLTAMTVSGLSGITLTTVTTGFDHSCALTAAGGVKCWGDNTYGQMGDGTNTARLTPVDVSGLTSGVVAIKAGGYHTCALTSGGGIKCWGHNGYGQLGDGTITHRTTPVNVSGLANGVTAITTSYLHTCALTSSGGVKCWGRNSSGQLGDGTTTLRLTPVDVTGLTSGVSAISAGGDHTCALTTLGGIKCWGQNTYGQLGDGTTANHPIPADVSGLTSGVVAITTANQTCALTTGGGMKCWGYNLYGQLGDGTTTNRLTPVDVSGLTSGVSAVAAGFTQTCARTTGAGLKCWGSNSVGQLGDGMTTNRLTPVDVSGLTSGVSAVAAGISHTCALTTSAGVKCWGENNTFGRLGDGTTTQRLTPVDVSGLTGGVSAIASAVAGSHTCAVTAGGGVKCWGLNASGQLGDGTTALRLAAVNVSGLASGVAAITTGGNHTCALTTAGGVKCWGYNGYGQLGDGTTTARTTPVNVSGLTSGVIAVTAGNNHTCALTTTGGVKCWGYNLYGQLGDVSVTNRLTPVDVSGLTSGVSAVKTGGNHTCALTTTGGVKCWGYNANGQVGNGTTTNQTAPVNVSGLTSGVSAIAGGNNHTCARTTGAGLKCWGYNGYGQLGDNTVTQRLTAVDVSGLTSGVATVTAGNNHTCAVTTLGGAKCWGNNSNGQLGDATLIRRLTPVDVSGLTSGVSALAAGSIHTCALTTTGVMKCWGDHSLGQLGLGATTQRTAPVSVSGLTNIPGSLIDAGGYHTCALTAAGGVKCWGANGGRLGDGTTTQRLTPVNVSGLTSGVTAITSGYQHTCALTAAGGVKCWGSNGNGQLGDGTTTTRLTPVDVNGLTSGVIAVSAGIRHTCALTTGGGVKCWGVNDNGQLGDGTTTQRLTPVDVSGLTSGAGVIAAGEGHTCARTTGGGLKCWGLNSSGQLGDATATSRLTPVDVSGLTSGVAAVATGNFYTCAVTTGAGLKCWGSNNVGQLGDGTTINRTAPVDVSGLTGGVSAVAAGAGHTCALTTIGGLKCWGTNTVGRLGDGTTTQRLTPVNVSGLTSGANTVTAGFDHTCAVAAGGTVKCWGDNSNGQLGNAGLYTAPISISASVTTAAYTYGNAAHKHAVTSLGTGETYDYDANGNMTSRTEGGVTYTQVFDAENRLVSVTANGQTTQFIYDGDGHLVKKVKPDGSRAIYVGGVYEVNKNAAGTITGTTTYYPAAGAMRVNGVLYYALKDQVNSSSVMLDSSGNTVGETRYYPFGETRVTSGSLFTDKLYTGQRQMAGLGLYDYNARFYSPKLGKFISPDTIVPGAGNPQNLNRYSYVRNNPIRYNDPSGHAVCGGMSYAQRYAAYCSDFDTEMGLNFINSASGKWSNKDKLTARQAIWDIDRAFSKERQTFTSVYGKVNLIWNTNCKKCKDASGVSAGGYTHGYLERGTLTIEFASLSPDSTSARNNFVHEFGHGFSAHLGSVPSDALYATQNTPDSTYYIKGFPNRPDPTYPKGGFGPTWGFGSYQGQNMWQQNPHGSESEEFADQFLGYTYGVWDTTNQGTLRSDWMNRYMPNWINKAAGN